MCDFHHHADFGFIVDVPEIRALIDETRRLSREIRDHAQRVEALRPAFSRLLAPDGDIHYVKTVSERPSVSIHLLANDTGCVLRHKYDPDAGTVVAFRSR